MSAIRINAHILSIPPYISASWSSIASLHVEQQGANHILVVTLLNGNCIEVPDLQGSLLETVFSAHAKFLEQDQPAAQNNFPQKSLMQPAEITKHFLSLEAPSKSNLEFEQFGGVLQHNPEQADTPDLPIELINKIAQLSQTIGIDDPNALPQPEPHCNCVHCQIAKAMQTGINKESKSETELSEEIVTEEDLTFRSWDIVQKDKQLFIVSNPIEAKEQYTVFLGEPMGCTCGEKHCEHIRAVLHS
ncbi:MAG: hypothetical protein K2P51_02165 [Rhabdochlamydiaceae bacterium]|nr:hypothetical protein [Rhabdochlamydiaceae bacterium]